MSSMSSWRLNILIVSIIMVAAIIISRLFYVQVLNHKLYEAQALGQQIGFQEIVGNRGEIFSANSKENRGVYGSSEVKSLALNAPVWTLYAMSDKITDKENFAKIIGEKIKQSKESVLSKIQKTDSYVLLAKNIPNQEVESLKQLDIEGLNFERSWTRYYPQGHLASQVIGFLGGDNNGQYGIEGYYEDILKGKRGIAERKRGLDIINSSNDQESLDGSSLYLTLDYNIQFEAESLLQEAKKNIDIDSGQIIVLKPDSGRILALANFPSFNVNEYSKESNFGVFQNSVIQKIFEPGSVFKPFTMAMALQEGKITPETTFTDTGFVKIGPNTLYNFDKKNYGEQDMSGILEKSINTGAVFLSQKVSHATFFNYVDRLGFNAKTGIDLQGEVSSRNSVLKNASDFVFATSSFGQGIEMTPIQLARAFGVFANGGKLAKPYIVEKIVHDIDKSNTKPQVSDQIISEKVASEVTKMLINVVDRGFGSAAKIDGYYLAGKTGTAEVPYENKKGYYPDKTIQSFIGFGPALNPQFIILVKLDNPKVPKSSLSAAPIFKKLAQYIIDYWQIPPDY